jgi:hypothetical protein
MPEAVFAAAPEMLVSVPAPSVAVTITEGIVLVTSGSVTGTVLASWKPPWMKIDVAWAPWLVVTTPEAVIGTGPRFPKSTTIVPRYSITEAGAAPASASSHVASSAPSRVRRLVVMSSLLLR